MQRRSIRERHEIRYDNRQQGLLIAGALVGVVVVFTLGVLSGRYLLGEGVREPAPGSSKQMAKAPAEKPEASIPAPPALKSEKPGAQVPSANDRFTFYRTLKEKEKLPLPPKPSPRVASKPKPKPKDVAGRFAIQVGAYRQQSDAKKVARTLKAKGYRAYIVTHKTPDKGTWYRVRIGPYATRKEAVAQAKAYEKRERNKPLLVPP